MGGRERQKLKNFSSFKETSEPNIKHNSGWHLESEGEGDLTEVVGECGQTSGVVVVIDQCRSPVWDDYITIMLESVLVLQATHQRI